MEKLKEYLLSRENMQNQLKGGQLTSKNEEKC